MNHDVEEAADEQAEQARDEGKEAGGALEQFDHAVRGLPEAARAPAGARHPWS